MTRPSDTPRDEPGPDPQPWARPDPLSLGPLDVEGPLVSPAVAAYKPAPPTPPSYEPPTGSIGAAPVTAPPSPGTVPPTPPAYYPPPPGYPPPSYTASPPGYTPPPPGYPPGYGVPPVYPTMAPTSGLAVASLVLGIVGVPFCLTVVVPVLAVIFGHLALPETRMGKAGAGMAVAGLVLGYSALALFVLGLFGRFLPYYYI